MPAHDPDSVLHPPPGSRRVLVMGILNITPDSFSDGGVHLDPQAAAAAAGRMADEGADILDIGAESTRPGAEAVDAATELRRLLPVIDAVRNAVSLPISVDTYKAAVAREALAAGAVIVNDIRGLRGDPDMAGVIADGGAAAVLMHHSTTTDYPEGVIPAIHDGFRASLEIADRAGIPRQRIALDPGIGFGKTPHDNLVILHHLSAFREHGLPMLLGASRKSFMGHALGLPVVERTETTLAVSALATAAGVGIIRVHDVEANVRAIRIAEAILNAAS